MPELPEIETLAQEFQERLAGRTILAVSVFQKARVFKTPGEVLKKGLPGKKIESVSRRGKFLFLNLSRGFSLVFHLGMTGQLLWDPADVKRGDPHLHLQLAFEGSEEKLFFRDIRRFGSIYFWDGAKAGPEGVRKLGADPFKLTASEFGKIFKPRRGRIKSLLLDQRLMAGLGNIYADESLFRSGLDPRRRPFRVSQLKLEALHRAVCEVLSEAVQCGGSSIDDYVHSDGSRGGFQEHHRVYGKAGSPCLACGTAIRRVVLAGRSSFFCPKCQT